jgi:hypothetical protein
MHAASTRDSPRLIIMLAIINDNGVAVCSHCILIHAVIKLCIIIMYHMQYPWLEIVTSCSEDFLFKQGLLRMTPPTLESLV